MRVSGTPKNLLLGLFRRTASILSCRMVQALIIAGASLVVLAPATASAHGHHRHHHHKTVPPHNQNKTHASPFVTINPQLPFLDAGKIAAHSLPTYAQLRTDSKTGPSQKHPRCASAVRFYLNNAGLEIPKVAHAKNMGPALERTGFVKVSPPLDGNSFNPAMATQFVCRAFGDCNHIFIPVMSPITVADTAHINTQDGKTQQGKSCTANPSGHVFLYVNRAFSSFDQGNTTGLKCPGAYSFVIYAYAGPSNYVFNGATAQTQFASKAARKHYIGHHTPHNVAQLGTPRLG